MNTPSVIEQVSESPAATELLAETLGRACQGGELFLLTGELGAGKTVFVRGLARGLGADPAQVRSPSYTLHHHYPAERPLNHFDVYFTDTAEDLERSGLLDRLAAGEVAAVEWGERFPRGLPDDRIVVEISHDGPERRRIRLRGTGPRSLELIQSEAG